MDRQQALNFSTDLLRISNWIYFGQDNLAEKFIELCEKKYSLSEKNRKLFGFVKMWPEDKYKAADAASTLSRLVV